jgi:putative SOS response-associated peptidase YedK
MANGATAQEAAIVHRAHHPTQYFVAEVHDRMPALVVEKGYDAWLDGSAGVELLKPASDNALQRSPVSKRVNSSMAPADDSTLIDRIDLDAA